MHRMKNRGGQTQSSNRETGRTLFDTIPDKTIHDATGVNSRPPSVREVVKANQRASSRLYREAEAMEFDPEEVYRPLERVQEEYDPFELADRRPIVDHSANYVAVGLNGADWHALFSFIKREIDDEEKSAYIAQVVTKVMSDITGANWHSQNLLPLVLLRDEVRDVLGYHKAAYDDPQL